MQKKEQKIFAIAMAALVIIAIIYFQSSNSLLGSWLEQFTEPNWQEVSERNIVKNSIPVVLLEEQDGKCKMTAQKFEIIIEHPYFIRGNDLAQELNYDKEGKTLMLPCDLLEGEKSRLNVWYALEESPKHSKKYQYFVTPWNETLSE